MLIEVASLSKRDAASAIEGLTKLRKGISKIRSDLRDRRVDADDIRKFVDCLRAAADYFETLLDESRSNENHTRMGRSRRSNHE